MKSRLIFFLHCCCLLSLVASSLASKLIKHTHPEFFAGIFVPGLGLVSVLTLASWVLFGGCPLTKWENHWRLLEGRRMYHGSCMVHYWPKRLGQPNSRYIHCALIVVMAYPLAVRFSDQVISLCLTAARFLLE